MNNNKIWVNFKNLGYKLMNRGEKVYYDTLEGNTYTIQEIKNKFNNNTTILNSQQRYKLIEL